MSAESAKSACWSLVPALAPLVKDCFLNDRLNSHGGIIEVLKTSR